ncbi:hypothetical protein PV326_006422, partial [Microctonus aethiopoides]
VLIVTFLDWYLESLLASEKADLRIKPSSISEVACGIAETLKRGDIASPLDLKYS